MVAIRHGGSGHAGVAGKFLAAAVFVWLMLTAFAPWAQAQAEYEVKAVFVCRFAQYVEWPTNTFAVAGSPIIIGVLGGDPFGRALDDASKGETPQNRRLVIKRFKRLEDVSSCQILFISQSEKPQLRQILEHLAGTGTLTVGDTESFVHLGGIINFTIQGGKIKLEINPGAAKNQGLKISAQLLKLAKLVPSSMSYHEGRHA